MTHSLTLDVGLAIGTPKTEATPICMTHLKMQGGDQTMDIDRMDVIINAGMTIGLAVTPNGEVQVQLLTSETPEI